MKIFPYLSLKISEDSDHLNEIYENREIMVSLIENICKIITSDSNFYSSTSKLIQNLSKFVSNLIGKIEKLSTTKKETYPILLLKVLNAFLTVFNHTSQNHFVQDFKDLYSKGLDVVNLILHQELLEKDRNFNNIKNICLYNYLVLLNSDQFISANLSFTLITEELFKNIFDLCDQCNIDSYAVYFRFVEKLYLPYILKKIDTNPDGIDEIMKLMKVCRNNLVENCKWTFRYNEINTLMNFILNEQLFFNDNVLKSKILNKVIPETWEIGNKYWLVQRSMIDHLFRIFYKFPEKMLHFYDVIIFLLKSKENRGFDANILFYLDEFFIPVNYFKKKKI